MSYTVVTTLRLEVNVRMRCVVCWAALLVLLIAPWKSFAATQCGAFSHDGNFATVKIQGKNLELNMASPGTRERTFSFVSGEAQLCRVSFSNDDQFLEVSLVRPRPSTSQIAVALMNVKSERWVNEKPIQPEYSQFPGGFVGDGHIVATAFLSGIWERGSSLRFQVFTIKGESGKLGDSILRPMDGPPTSLFPTSFDVANNRLWHRVPETACDLRGISVLDNRSAYDVSTSALPGCVNPALVEFPTANLVVLASQNQESIRLWRYSLEAKRADTLNVPLEPSRALQLLSLSAHSPDGRVVALAIKVLTKDRFGGLHPGSYAVALIDTESWALLAVHELKLTAFTQLAVDHHDGQVTVEANDGSHWVRFSDVR